MKNHFSFGFNWPICQKGPYADLGGNTICVTECVSDVYGDGTVDVNDLLQVIAAWGNPGGDEDINIDGTVDVNDILVLIAGWGVCP